MFPGTSEVVLRNTLMDGEAVRVGRAGPPRAMRPGTGPQPHAEAVASSPAAQPPTPDPEVALEQALAEARAEGLRLGREEGLRTGHEEGLKKGQLDAQASVRAAVEKAVTEATAPLRERERQLAALVAAFGEQQAAWRDLGEEEAVALAYEVLCRVLGSTLLTPEGVHAQARALLASARQRDAVFHVHPDDAILLCDLATADGLRWLPDPEVRLGGCVLRGTAGELDARLETILAQCRDGLLEARAQGAAPAGDKP